MKEKMVSVIIPCYNAEKTIKNAIESVLNQTYKNIEIIVINDGSVDLSAEVVEQVKTDTPMKIILINQKNAGVSAARNHGMEMAEGQYILFLDADDSIERNMVKILVTEVEEKKADTAYCTWTHEEFTYEERWNSRLEDNAELLRKQMLRRQYRISFFNYLYKKEILDQNKIVFPENLKYGEDIVFVMKYLAFCKLGSSIDFALYQYKVNDASAMHNLSWRMTDVLEGIEMIENCLVGNSMHDKYCQYAYPRTIWALAKDFAVGGRKDLFQKLEEEYDVKANMKKLCRLRDAEKLVRISGGVYCINKKKFFYIMQKCVRG